MRISQEKREKISEQILAFLFQNSPRAFFTSDIARETARDEEFIKVLLQELESKKFAVSIKKNSKGADYTKRTRWRLSDKVYNVYNQLQKKGIEVY